MRSEAQHNGRRENHNRRVVSIGGVPIGAGTCTVIAGPCAVEDLDQLSTAAHGVADRGAAILRGGAFKPRTSPRSFQGLGHAGLELLARAREETGLPVVTELLDVRDVEAVADIADAIQIGARNMHAAYLLREAARTGLPIVLKRNPGATLDELLAAAEYVLDEGNESVILCERGIRTFENSTRYTLDLSAVPVLRQRTSLPVIVDPSHAAGRADIVADLACGAAAVGADGILVEVHPDPAHALSDGAQSLDLDGFASLMARLQPIVEADGRVIASSRLVPNDPLPAR